MGALPHTLQLGLTLLDVIGSSSSSSSSSSSGSTYEVLAPCFHLFALVDRLQAAFKNTLKDGPAASMRSAEASVSGEYGTEGATPYAPNHKSNTAWVKAFAKYLRELGGDEVEKIVLGVLDGFSSEVVVCGGVEELMDVCGMAGVVGAGDVEGWVSEL